MSLVLLVDQDDVLDPSVQASTGVLSLPLSELSKGVLVLSVSLGGIFCSHSMSTNYTTCFITISKALQATIREMNQRALEQKNKFRESKGEKQALDRMLDDMRYKMNMENQRWELRMANALALAGAGRRSLFSLRV